MNTFQKLLVVSLLSLHWETPLWVLSFSWKWGNRNLRERNLIRFLRVGNPAFQGSVKHEGLVMCWFYAALCCWSLWPKQGKVELPALWASQVLLLWYSNGQKDLKIAVLLLIFSQLCWNHKFIQYVLISEILFWVSCVVDHLCM